MASPVDTQGISLKDVYGLLGLGTIGLVGTGVAFLVSLSKQEEPKGDDTTPKELSAWKKIIFAIIIVVTIVLSSLFILLHFRKQLFSEKVVEGRLFV
jgi:hypothetical protein